MTTTTSSTTGPNPHLLLASYRDGLFNLKNAAAAHLRRCTKLEMACAIPSHRAPCSWTTSAFSGHQMGGQERVLKLIKAGDLMDSPIQLRF